ncbi:diguanylate cyclase [Scytonema sp. NUACC26]|uniref:diguanylate cyclase n=1 Tax=Scytonema sp. NUACC26 TaxID=3140176 RepID=UPI0034DC46FF
MCSVIVYGSYDFFGTLPPQILSASSDRIYRTESLNEATLRIQKVPPDVIVIQAGFSGREELCRWLKNNPDLLWIHVIILEDRPELLALSAQQMTVAELAAKEQGADAYIFWHYLTEEVGSTSKEEDTKQLLIEEFNRGVSKTEYTRSLFTIAYTDRLTKLDNRAALERDLPEQIKIARRCDGTPLSVIMLELDRFKQVNDNYGHPVGDRVLQQLSCRLRSHLESDGMTIYRYGGDEFIIIASNRTCEATLDVARHLRSKIGEELFLVDRADDVLTVKLTLSIGVTCLHPEDDPQGESLLKRADEYMYEVKKAGGNNVVGCSGCSYHEKARAIAIFER